MKIIRFDSVGGASGDMILGALIGLGVDVEELNTELKNLLPDEFLIKSKPWQSHGINNGIQVEVEIHEHTHHHHHHGRDFNDIKSLIEDSGLPSKVKAMSLKVFGGLAEAEGKVHNKPAGEVHFHEVGAVDSIVDIVGCCLAFHKLGAEAISVSPLPTGTGTFKCRHGTYPLPAPATLEMLKLGLQSAPTDEPFELVTPTGAALLAILPKAEIPADAAILKSSDSFGHRELNNRPNLLRASLYESSKIQEGKCKLTILETNIDDSTPELIGYVFNKLLKAGALDVWTQPIGMKKQRPGVLLSVLCSQDLKAELLELILTETTSFGAREYEVTRHCMQHRFEEKETPYGKIRIKIASFKGRDLTRSPEFSDCAALAEKHNVPLKEIMQMVLG
ncbi:MAG: nickel pincer cofactor biosynthesis protein LarC [Victivallaceae bacterium]|nr:nickel pincer cofactor biosynthesis protein LarC [Victivallaceae bacterium]